MDLIRSLTYLFTFEMEQQLVETNRLLALILAELKTSNETSRNQVKSIIDMIRKWASLSGTQIHL
jgi:hypothetical protein